MLKTVKQVRDAMAELDDKYKAAQEKAERDGIEALSDDEKAQIRSYTSARGDLQEKLEILMQLEFTRSQTPANMATPGSAEYTENDQKDLKKFSLLRGLQLLTNEQPLDGVEKEVHVIGLRSARQSGLDTKGLVVPSFIPVQQRGQSVTGQTTAPGDQGGLLVETVVNPLIEAIWSETFLSQAGARRLAGLTGDMTFPVQKTKPVAQEVAETEKLTAQEILFEDFEMKPKRRGITIPISKQLILQTSFDVQGFVIDVIRLAMEEKMNLDAIAELLSVINSANGNLIELGTNGAKLTYADIVKMETLLASSDRAKNTIKYLTNTKVRGLAKLTQKFEDTNGNTIWEPGNTMNSYPAIISNLIPSTLTKGTAASKASAVILGDFAKLFVGIWGGTEFVVDPYTLADEGKVKITSNMFWNVKAGQPKSFVGIKDALTE